MSKKRPARLWLRTEMRAGRESQSYWVILDVGDDGHRKQIRTGCSASQTEDAARALADYIANKCVVQHGGRAAEVTIGDVLFVYLEDKAEGTRDPRLTRQIIGRLNDFFGAEPVAAIKGKLCRDYAAVRGTQSGARKDLEILRAAVRYYHGEHGLDVLPKFTLPQKSLPRERYLTRSEAAALLWAALGWKRTADGKWVRDHTQEYRGVHTASWRGRRHYYAWKGGPALPGVPGSPEFKAAFKQAYASPEAPKRLPVANGERRRHLTRLILIGIYTGTRPGTILSLQWTENTHGGYADLETGVIHRKAKGERVAHNKRKTAVKIAPRLLAHLQRWKRLDEGNRHIVHYNGAPVAKLNKAFRGAIAAAGLDSAVTPHVLRHTRGTWLAQAGVDAHQAATSLGLTVDEYERTYLHNDPEFQRDAANAY